MADYAITLTDEDALGITEVNVAFTTDSLDDIVEQFYWFIKRAGFDYAEGISIDGVDGPIAEFPSCE